MAIPSSPLDPKITLAASDHFAVGRDHFIQVDWIWAPDFREPVHQVSFSQSCSCIIPCNYPIKRILTIIGLLIFKFYLFSHSFCRRRGWDDSIFWRQKMGKGQLGRAVNRTGNGKSFKRENILYNNWVPIYNNNLHMAHKVIIFFFLIWRMGQHSETNVICCIT